MTNILRSALLVPSILLLLQAPLRAQGTGTVRGQVTAASSHEPIADATVRVEGAAVTALTDGAGRYVLTGVPAGARVVTARRVGYALARATVVARADSPVTADLVMAESAVALPDVVVTATRAEQRAAEVPANIGVVSAGEIQAARPHTPGEIVDRVPGALVVDLGGEGNVVALRQPINFAAVYAYLEDGIPIRSTGFFNHNALYEINMPGAERIEVLKGPGTALYGSDAIAGVFNVLTRAPSASPTVEAFAEGGASGYGRTLLSGSGTWGASGLRADLNVTHFDGARDNAHFDRQSGTLRWDLALGARSHLHTVFAVSNINSPGDGGSDISQADLDSRSTVNYTPVAFRKVQAVRLSSAWETESGPNRFTVTAYARYNRLNLLPYWQLTYDPQVWDSKNHSFGLMLQLRRTLAPGADLVLGADADLSPGSRIEDQLLPQQTGQIFTSYTTGVRQYDYAVTFHGVSPYAQLEWSPVSRLHLSGGVRFDAVGYDYTNHLTVDDTSAHRRPPSSSVSYTHVSPKLGATWELSDALSVFAAYRHGFRVPSEDQLFVQGSAINTLGLQPVRANSYEVGLRGRAGRLAFEASAYTMDITNDILTFYDTLNFTLQTSNAGSTRHEGIEVGAGLRLARTVSLDAAWSLMRHRYLTWVTQTGSDFSGNDMESGSRDLINARLGWTPGRHSVTLEWAHVGHYFLDPDNLHAYGGFDLLNAYFRFTLSPAFAVSGRVHNLADVRYSNTTSFNPFVAPADQVRYTPGPRRSLYLGLQYTWQGATGGAR